MSDYTYRNTDELRLLQPLKTAEYSDSQLINIYESYSEELWCAGWMMPNEHLVSSAIDYYEELSDDEKEAINIKEN